ncbi:ArnT family glycosyltransferase [Desulfoplanes formicivorans]|nr:glycosyltransferase family 39 protein [Desulfoplanes formicivorans]
MNYSCEKKDHMNTCKFSYRHEMQIFFVLFVIGIFYRILTADYISYGGDAMYKWFQVKRLLYGFDFTGWDKYYPTWNQHTSRWAINGVTYIFQYVFGTHPVVMYLCVFFMFSISLIFLFLISLRINGVYFATTSCLIYIFFPVMDAIGSQLLPGIFSITYMLIAIYFMILYVERDKFAFLFIHILFVFLAYSSKITSVFFIPIFMIFLYKKKKKSLPLMYALSLIVLFFIEVTAFYFVSDGSLVLGKMSCIIQGHGRGGDIDLNHMFSFMTFFERWIKLPISWKLLFFISLLSSLYILKKFRNSWISFIAVLCLCFVFFETFAIKSINPIKIAEPIRVRYLSVILPLMILMVNYVLCNIFLLQKSFIRKAVYVLLICAIPILYFKEIHLVDNNIYKVYIDEKIINSSFENNKPEIFENKKKAYRYLYVFLKDNYVFSNSSGELLMVKNSYNGTNNYYEIVRK